MKYNNLYGVVADSDNSYSVVEKDTYLFEKTATTYPMVVTVRNTLDEAMRDAKRRAEITNCTFKGLRPASDFK